MGIFGLGTQTAHLVVMGNFEYDTHGQNPFNITQRAKISNRVFFIICHVMKMHFTGTWTTASVVHDW